MAKMNCEKIKELINEEIDGMLENSAKQALFEHIKVCPDCARVYHEMKLMTGAVRTIEFIEPEYLEAKINLAVADARARGTQPVFAKKFVPAMGFSFLAVFAMAFFIIYNNSGSRNIQTAAVVESQKSVSVASVPAVKKAPAAEKNLNTEINTITKAEEPKAFVRNEAPVYENKMVRAPANQPLTQNEKVNVASVTENKPQFSVAKDEGTPTPGTGILDRERAVIADNVINPNRGMAATVKFKVDEASRVKITVYDKSVRVVAVLLDAEKQPGTYEVPWYGKTDGNIVVRDGVYFMTIQIGKQVIKRNVVISKNF